MKTGPPKLFRRWRGDIGGSEELETLPRQGPQWVVCHERRRSYLRRATVREMKEGPSSSVIRHRKLLRAKAVVVSVAETPGQDFGRHGRARRAQANRCRSVESGLGDVRTGG